MLVGEPARTPYDLNFSAFGFPVRIAPWFWLVALLLGSNVTTWEIRGAPIGGMGILVWILAMFLSILIHELGHAFAYRHFGKSSHIVLYQFGGLAIADAYGSSWGGRSTGPKQNIWISVAGPAAETVTALLLVLVVRSLGHGIPTGVWFLDAVWPPTDNVNSEVGLFFYCFCYVSIFWGLINLMPVYPLDGGQIARDLFALFGGSDAIQNSLMLSVATGAGLALYGLAYGQTLLGLMFAMLAYSSYQMLTVRGGGFGRRW